MSATSSSVACVGYLCACDLVSRLSVVLAAWDYSDNGYWWAPLWIATSLSEDTEKGKLVHHRCPEWPNDIFSEYCSNTGLRINRNTFILREEASEGENTFLRSYQAPRFVPVFTSHPIADRWEGKTSSNLISKQFSWTLLLWSAGAVHSLAFAAPESCRRIDLNCSVYK